MMLVGEKKIEMPTGNPAYWPGYSRVRSALALTS